MAFFYTMFFQDNDYVDFNSVLIYIAFWAILLATGKSMASKSSNSVFELKIIKRVVVLQMNQNRLDKYSKTNEKIVPWTLFIIFLISFQFYIYFRLKKLDLILQMILIVIKLLFVKYMI